MEKGGSGIGVGSSSIVLVFAVLCLTVFSLITLVIAKNNKALSEAEASLVVSYYEADDLAERVLADICQSQDIPENVRGIDIKSGWDPALEMEVASYVCPLSDKKELYVKVAFDGDACSIINWQMLDIGTWEFDDSLGVWLGDDNFEIWMLGDN